MFKVADNVRTLSEEEKKQYLDEGYITGLTVFSDEAKNDLDNFFVSISLKLNKEVDINQTAQ